MTQPKIVDALFGDSVGLVYNRVIPASEALEAVPAYLFNIVLLNGTPIGQIDLRLGSKPSLLKYGGQLGYGIRRGYRGHSYAAEACLLLKTVALEEGFSELWITCNPDNIASIRTCEKIGATYIERVDVPQGSELWRRGDRAKLRYLWSLT
ncbi:GNAT family N-acetyltransferase [Reinekea thalattae]|uniref:GNAT family N-acetyltransferase n=1 Tax=Reinekea thalattae TaxID=2593301 RepID=UPI00165015F5|nr:GNAT family N-acetyltransferase [Reinekea thalattae]